MQNVCVRGSRLHPDSTMSMAPASLARPSLFQEARPNGIVWTRIRDEEAPFKNLCQWTVDILEGEQG